MILTASVSTVVKLVSAVNEEQFVFIANESYDGCVELVYGRIKSVNIMGDMLHITFAEKSFMISSCPFEGNNTAWMIQREFTFWTLEDEHVECHLDAESKRRHMAEYGLEFLDFLLPLYVREEMLAAWVAHKNLAFIDHIKQVRLRESAHIRNDMK